MTDRTIIAGVRVTLVALSVLWGLYLVLLPPEELRASNLWVEVLRLVPNRSPDLLGFGFLVGPLVSGVAALLPHGHAWARYAYACAVLGLGASGAVWAVTAWSYAVAAWRLQGLGTATAATCAAVAVLYLLLAFEFKGGRIGQRTRRA